MSYEQEEMEEFEISPEEEVVRRNNFMKAALSAGDSLSAMLTSPDEYVYTMLFINKIDNTGHILLTPWPIKDVIVALHEVAAMSGEELS